jgi:hypothetical protein
MGELAVRNDYLVVRLKGRPADATAFRPQRAVDRGAPGSSGQSEGQPEGRQLPLDLGQRGLPEVFDGQ